MSNETQTEMVAGIIGSFSSYENMLDGTFKVTKIIRADSASGCALKQAEEILSAMIAASPTPPADIVKAARAVMDEYDDDIQGSVIHSVETLRQALSNTSPPTQEDE